MSTRASTTRTPNLHLLQVELLAELSDSLELTASAPLMEARASLVKCSIGSFELIFIRQLKMDKDCANILKRHRD